IVTIIPLYMLFALIYFICSKLKTKNKYYIAGWVLALVPLCFEVITWCVGTGGTYTREIMCFSIGCIYATLLLYFIVQNQKMRIDKNEPFSRNADGNSRVFP
ncbi:MAG: hypothetical protein IJ969_06430, partial [Anaerotignum sp.]|nr:hypothetical protein [Anaerotignum sp.]